MTLLVFPAFGEFLSEDQRQCRGDVYGVVCVAAELWQGEALQAEDLCLEEVRPREQGLHGLTEQLILLRLRVGGGFICQEGISQELRQ